MFTPYYFGNLGDVTRICGANYCTLDMWKDTIDPDSEYAFMPNGNRQSMQWAALYSAAGVPSPASSLPLGLYVGAHSPNADMMMLLVDASYISEPPGQQHAGLRCDAASRQLTPTLPILSSAGLLLAYPLLSPCRWLHLPNNLLDNSTSELWSMQYDVVLAGYEGDWWDAAMIYRRWALENAVWTRQGNLTVRAQSADYPSWLLKAPLWTESSPQPGHVGNPDGAFASNAELVKILGAPIGCHWYGWNTEKFDTNYPSYTPYPNFSDAVAQHQAHGIFVVPYNNGRVMDPTIPEWTSDSAWKYACKHQSGKHYIESTHYTNFSVMDPSTAYWQKKLSTVAGVVVRTHNTSGICERANIYMCVCCLSSLLSKCTYT